MIYGIIILICIILILNVSLLLVKKQEYREFVDLDDLCNFLSNASCMGGGVSVKDLRKTIQNQYKKAIKKSKDGELFGFEQWLVDHHYRILSVLRDRRLIELRHVPHCENIPRIMYIVRFAISHGYDKSITSLIDYLKQVQEKIHLDYNELVLYTYAVKLGEVELLTDSASFSIRCFKYDRVSKRSGSIDLYNQDELYFYAMNNNLHDCLEATINESIKNFEQKLLAKELMVKHSLKIINRDEQELTKNILPFFSHCDGIFARFKNYQNVSISTRCAYMREIARISNKLNIPEICIAQGVLYLSETTNLDISEVLFDYKLVKNYLKRGNIKQSSKVNKSFFYVLAVLIISGLSFLVFLFDRTIDAIVFVPMLWLMSIKSVEYLLKQTLTILRKPPVFAMGYEKIPDGGETVVIVSQYINSLECFEKAYKNIHSLSYNCKDKKVSYLLLIDFPKKDANNEGEENKIFEYIRQIKNDRVVVAIRKRVLFDGEYVAYQRKRGAILDLFEGIITKNSDKFHLFGKELPDSNYAILLDDDSAILPGTIINAINTIMHPYNQKYQIMSFGTKINKHSITTEYSLRYSDDGSIDQYPFYSDIYSDVFDVGLFCGKGIVRIKEYYYNLVDRFADNSILSHDLIEGAILKCGSLKLSVYEDAPKSFKSDSDRYRRWLKGDILLLPFIGIKNRNKNGKWINNKIDLIYKLLFFINGTEGVRNFFYILAVFIGVVCSRVYFVIITASLLIFPYAIRIIHSLVELVKGVCIRYVFRDCLKTISHCFERIFFLPYYAITGIELYFVTTYQSLRSSKKLMEWKPFYLSQSKSNFFVYSKLFLPSKFFMSALALISGNVYFLGYAGVYVFYAFIVYKGKSLYKAYNDEENYQLTEIAKRTYKYFEKANYNGLVVDNLQFYPVVKQTIMTSATDLGFGLIAQISAIELKIVSKKQGENKILKLLRKMDSLKRYKGHFYNWYDVTNGKPMYPYNISTADSGNLSACLYCVSAYARKVGNQDILELSSKMNSFDFSFLFDSSRGLLFISYLTQENRGEGYYDIFESETRLAYYIAISKGLNINAWFNTSRRFIGLNGNTLLSWFGSSFEYLMPGLFLPTSSFTMQEGTEKNVAKVQFSNNYKGCIGVSECAVCRLNDDFHYEYEPNGIHEIAEKFEKGEYTFSPYSCLLCLPYSKGEVLDALNSYIKCGLLSDTGFYESISDKGIAFLQMTHHQGMIITSIANRLKGNLFVSLFMDNPETAMAKMLLCEPYIRTKSDYVHSKGVIRTNKGIKSIKMNPGLYQAATLIGNEYSILYTSQGDNRTYIKGKELTPYYGCGQEGKRLYIKSQTSKMYQDLYQSGEAIYSEDYISFYNSELKITETIKLSSDGKGELRRISFEKVGHEYSIIHYFDVFLHTLDEMYSHRTFYELFVNCKVEDNQAFYWTDNLCVGVKVLGFDAIKITSNRLNVNSRYNSIPDKIFGKYPNDGKIVYPCFAVSGDFFAENNRNSIYIIQTHSENIEECRKVLDEYNYEKINEAYDLLIYKNRSSFIGKNGIDLLGSIFMLPYKSSELDLTLFDDFSVIKYHYLNDTEDLSFISTIKAIKSFGIKVAVLTNEDGISGALRQKLSEEKINILKGNYATKSTWGEERKRIEFPTIDRLNKPKYSFDDNTIMSGNGGFIDDGYVVSSDRYTEKPYSNVVSNGIVGFIATENGMAYSWIDNSRESKITVWRNDERSNHSSENVFLFVNNKLYDLTSAYNSICIHKRNETIYLNKIGRLKIKVSVYIGGNGKCIVKKVSFDGEFDGSLKIIFGYRLSLSWRPNGFIHANSEKLNKIVLVNKLTKIKTAINCEDGVSFVGINKLCSILTNCDYTGDYADYVGFVCDFNNIQSKNDCYVSIGTGYDKGVYELKDNLVRIKTNDKYLDVLFNRWLFKQVLDCRMYARASFYQCSGAYGFRDQLQDCLALLYSYPEMVKEHILLCASHQYEEGDVMHWWHMPKTGVRTKNSDDRLFLCYLVSKYINRTGDKSILNRRLPFLVSKPLSKNELSRFETPSITKTTEPLIEHLKRAIKSALKFGKDSLLLVGSGDWNDGFDGVGLEMRGESVWLSMFAYLTLTECIDIFSGEDRLFIVNRLDKLKIGINNAFVIDRFYAYVNDNGEIIGLESSKNCSLYLPTQAFAVLCGAIEPSVYNVALDSAKNLIDRENGIIKIYDKPFKNPSDWGYITRYPMGVRENGGQYTHAALWFIKALFKADLVDEAYELLNMINPAKICSDRDGNRRYGAEPYVISADVYDENYKGRAGWSWYTGSASWFYEIVVDSMFGVKFIGGNMYIEPKLPSKMDVAELRITIDGTEYICNFYRSNIDQISVNGIFLNERYITPEKNKGKVFVRVDYIPINRREFN